MGVFTSSQIIPDKSIGVVQGNKPAQTYLDPKNKENKFRFKVKLQGKSDVFIPNGNKEPIKVELVDGEIDLGKKTEKNSLVLDFLRKSPDFEDISYATDIKEVETKKHNYFALHPEHTKESPIEGTIEIDVDGKACTFLLEKGIITTDDPKVFQILLDSGYTEAKKKKEIKE